MYKDTSNERAKMCKKVHMCKEEQNYAMGEPCSKISGHVLRVQIRMSAWLGGSQGIVS